jgi:hypothetical protein
MYDASLKMLDTVNNSMTEKVKNSFYGKRFQEYVNTIKEKEKKIIFPPTYKVKPSNLLGFLFTFEK